MGIFSLISMILSTLPGLISAVESVYGAVKGQGAVKKQAVLGAVGGIVDAIGSTAGNSATAAQKPEILAMAGTTIDGLVSAYNAVGTFTGSSAIAVDNTPIPATVFPSVEAGH